MKLGIIKSNFPDEKRVPLLPQDIGSFPNKLYIQTGLGNELNIPDKAYEEKGAIITTKATIFKECDGIFSLKLIQKEDYHLIRENQIIIGWTHPLGSGKYFMEQQALPKNLIVVDLDNRFPTLFYQNTQKRIKWIPTNFVRENSFYAGYAGTLHALLSYGLLPTSNERIAILGSGNVSQGAFYALFKFGTQVTMFYRRTLPEFKNCLSDFDIIINGIEVGERGQSILSLAEQQTLKDGCFIIDIAADAGNAIKNDKFTSIKKPIYFEDNHCIYCVPNTPTLAYRNVSKILSKQFSKYIFSKDIEDFKWCLKNDET
ncbi:N(5)-(carboxyethyl)ornithine synthase [Enterococcus sp. AN402]|uniref:N(5)-(carboxyethyl)ornithine synthase n=1 Tax=Enterococcus sp. AN402 TaxID=3151386 RepID=UPI003459F5CB